MRQSPGPSCGLSAHEAVSGSVLWSVCILRSVCLCRSPGPSCGLSASRGLSAHEAVSGSIPWSVCLRVSLWVCSVVCLPVCQSLAPSHGLSAREAVSGSILWSVCIPRSVCLCVSLRVCLPVCQSPAPSHGLSACEAVSGSVLWSVCIPQSVCLCQSPGLPRGLSAHEAVSGSVPWSVCILWSVCLCVGLRVCLVVCLHPVVCLPVRQSPGPSHGLSACVVSLWVCPVECLPVYRSPGSPRGLSGHEAVSRSAPWSICLCVGLRVRPAVCRGLRGCLTLLVLRMSNMSGKPSVTSSSLYSSSLMELKSRRRLCTTEYRDWEKDVLRDSIQTCSFQGTPGPGRGRAVTPRAERSPKGPLSPPQDSPLSGRPKRLMPA